MLYQGLLRPLFFKLDCETAHHLAHLAGVLAGPVWPVLSGFFTYSGDDLKQNLAGVELANPVGLAAGFDKNGLLAPSLGSLGFGFAEIGSVTARASKGNPKPRCFRLPADEALINRMGLNGDGADVVAARLVRCRFSLPLGINIAKTNDPDIQGDAAVEDILYTYRQVRDLPVSFLTINTSCPNTTDGIMEETRELAIILHEIAKDSGRRLPVFVKLSPDSTPQLIEDIVACASETGVAGLICGNTTVSRAGLITDGAALSRIGNGGLSGRPLKPLALALVRAVFKLKTAEQVIVACGGISSGDDAYDFVRAGANAVQLYTGLVYQGPTLPRDINSQLSRLLKRDKITLQEAVGISA